MKIYIMTDLEGVSGVRGGKDAIGNKITNNDEACRLLTEEVNAVIDGLLSAGAKEIDVMDGHGGSNSISIEHLRAPARLINVGPGLTPVTYGMNASFDAVIQLGAHAMMGIGDGFLNHTYNSHSIVNMKLNGELIGEIGMYSLISAYFSVPTVLVSGDRAACMEANEFLGNVETVETKIGMNRYSVINKNPADVRAELKDKSAKAIKELKKYKVKTLRGPYVVKIEFMCPNMADEAEKIGARRIGHNTIEIKSSNLIDLWSMRNGWATGVHNKLFNIK